MQRNIITAAVAAALIGIAGCQTAPETNSTLEAARAAVQGAQSNPDVTKYAPTELNRARGLLTNAEGAASENGVDDESTSHYAYLATQVARVAEQRAQEQVAIGRIKAGESERQQILLSARESEATQAIAQARSAQTRAELARNEAQNAQSQMAQAMEESQRLADQLEELKAAQTPRGMVLTLDDVLFDTAQAELKSGAQRSLDQIAQFLQQHPERRVQIEGFTDSRGTDEFNLQLSQRRADAVASAIIQRGIDSQRVRAVGYGEGYPVASNDNSGSRQMNRRVEIVVGNDNRAIPSRADAGTP